MKESGQMILKPDIVFKWLWKMTEDVQLNNKSINKYYNYIYNLHSLTWTFFKFYHDQRKIIKIILVK